MSPDSSFKTDTVDKKAVYADAGIPAYLIVFLTAGEDAVEKIEEYWLEPTGAYGSSSCTPGGWSWTLRSRSTSGSVS